MERERKQREQVSLYSTFLLRQFKWGDKNVFTTRFIADVSPEGSSNETIREGKGDYVYPSSFSHLYSTRVMTNNILNVFSHQLNRINRAREQGWRNVLSSSGGSSPERKVPCAFSSDAKYFCSVILFRLVARLAMLKYPLAWNLFVCLLVYSLSFWNFSVGV